MTTERVVLGLLALISTVNANLQSQPVVSHPSLYAPLPAGSTNRVSANAEASNFDVTVDAAPPGFEQWVSPVVLPSPVQQGQSAWSASIERAKSFVAQLTLEEKVNLTTGAGTEGRCIGETGTVPRLGFDQPICFQDGPVGVRSTDFNTVFPASINTAATFDKELIYRRAQALASEFKGKGINVGLAPMTNLMRAPEGGRGWEGFGADPYFSGVATVQSILGIQSTRLSACVKHYIANEQEHYRGGSATTAQSSNIDDRTLREVYEWPFAEAIQAGVDYIMCAYNRINQTYACENSKLLNGIAKGEHRFQGVVVTDWAAATSGVRTALAGTDLNMPGFVAYGNKSEPDPATSQNSYWGARMIDAVKNGSVPMARIDDMVTRVISTYYKQGQDKEDYPRLNFMAYGQGTSEEQLRFNKHVNVQADHYRLVREIGGASTVLLKNVNNTLPLRPPAELRAIAVIGSDAGGNPKGANGCVDRGCDNGTLAASWGSGTSNFPHLITPASAIEHYALDANPTMVLQTVLDDYSYTQAQNASSGADVAIVHVNSDSGEGYITVEGNAGDRNNISLWHDGDTLILKVAEVCETVVVVIHTVGAIDMEKWIDHPHVKAVLLAGLPGQESGHAEVDVLWGQVNPSGRLPYTIARAHEHYPAQVLFNSTMDVPQVTYSERLNIDYRHFDTKNIKPRFEFGFGLSYTTFKYMDLSLTNQIKTQNTPDNLFENVFSAKFSVANVGHIPGHEVAQLYIGFPPEVGEPPKVLRGFERVYLKNQAFSMIEMKLRRKDLSYWDVTLQRWMIPSGEFQVFVGCSSRNIQLTDKFKIQLS